MYKCLLSEMLVISVIRKFVSMVQVLSSFVFNFC